MLMKCSLPAAVHDSEDRDTEILSKINNKCLQDSKNRVSRLFTRPHRINKLRFISILSQIMLSDTEPTGGFIPTCEILCFYLNFAHFCRKSITHCSKFSLFPHVLSCPQGQNNMYMTGVVSCKY